MLENEGTKTKTFWNGSSFGRKMTAVENMQYLQFFSTRIVSKDEHLTTRGVGIELNGTES